MFHDEDPANWLADRTTDSDPKSETERLEGLPVARKTDLRTWLVPIAI